jgi:hypothetical protein
MDLHSIKFVATASSYLNHYLSLRHVPSVLTFGTNIDKSQEQSRNHLTGRGACEVGLVVHHYLDAKRSIFDPVVVQE